ncbi:DUF748 domain-containing protein [Variovorax sp. VNK109]|uniref:DUF748 domain-containing protein n=1 Tax=Variovorax sp. VNK109 TaxID=3400919 RepID=UPI003C10C582
MSNMAQILGRKWVRKVLWAVLGLLAIWAVAWVAVPPLVKSQLQKQASLALGRDVTVGEVDFRPWSLELTLRQLSIAGAEGAPPQLTVQRIYIDGELQSLLRLAPVVDAVQVDEPLVRLRHLGAGRYDIDDVLQKLSGGVEPEKPADPLRFALYNLAIQGGSLDFQDDSVGKTHALRDFALGVPFLSNLPSQREVKVLPRLAFSLNGSRFDSTAEGTPFDETRKTDAAFRLNGFDLSPYLAYLPASLPVRLKTASVDADMKVYFEQVPQMAVRLSGTVQISGLKLTDRQDAPLLDFRSLRIGLADVRPLERSVKLSELVLDTPELAVTRGAGGQVNLVEIATPPKPAEAKSAPTAVAVPDTATPGPAWRVELARLSVQGATVKWHDATLRPAADLALTDFGMEANAVAWPASQPIPFSGAGKLAQSQISFKGEATADAAQLDAQLDGLSLQVVAPYLRPFIEPTLSGTLSAQTRVAWKPDGLQIAVPAASIANVALANGKTQLAGLGKLEVADVQADLAKQTLAVGRLGITQPRLRVERDADGVWMYERWLRSTTPAGASSAESSKPWAVTLAEFSLEGGAVSFADRFAARSSRRPVALEVSALKLLARNVAPDTARAAQVNMSARIATPRSEPGRVDFRGTVAPRPLVAQGRLEAVAVPAHAFAAYLQQFLNIELLRADASFRGQVRFAQMPAGPAVQVSGDTSLEDFRANTVPLAQVAGAPAGFSISEELLSWKALSLRGLEVAMAPGTMTRVNVRETTLADFYARVTINPDGRINLQDLVRHDPPSAGQPATASASATATAPVAEGPPADIRFGPISLVNGRVLFSDYFVRPNYSANLSELTGRLGAFSSLAPQGEPELADLELRGRAEGTASLEITGKLNPLAKPLALDVRGKVRDLELSPLSPYSIKYAGHGIERGKLSVDVAYKVQPDGQLTASNKLVLNQLTFSEPVPGAPNSLPVKLAVALLADRNGVIDIDLPISGSLNDPQFSLGPVIFKVIVNLIVKAITSPFSLLAGAFGGGGDELSAITFPAGTSEVTPQSQQSLDKIAKALADRPALRMTVVGAANLDAERDAFKRDRLRQLVQAEKRRVMVLGGQSASGTVTVSDAEYPALLRAVYRRADMPKPRNLVGMMKELPQDEMESLLLASIPVTPDLMRELAVQRGVAVKDYLASRQIPAERLFLGAPALPAVAATTAAEGAWRPRAELSLATR